MSTTIDQRVVEMRFDNKQFESNVQTSMSTIDKLKQKLNFTGATKGLENIGSAAKKIDMSGLGNAVETVRLKFSALEVVGVTALVNITNAAFETGKKMVSALSLDPILTGFQEYETQINAVQTILANTQSKGTTLDQVNAALDELNSYADKTIYNFTEMTRNIGTFTAAGVGLEKSVTSIKGIANLAAVSGSSAQQASTAMYQLSQAIAAGKVQLMDWNSVVNAGMGGELFQNALKRTAENFGTNVDAMIAKYGSFRESLTKGGWLTSEVLTETLTQLSGAYTEADLIAQGYTESQAREITQLAQTAVDAATKVKTFTQLWDTLKEAAQSGWTQSWEIIVGDFEEARELLTTLSDLFSGIINRISDSRNTLLEGAFGSKWDQLIEKINAAGIATEDFQSALIETAKDHGIAIDEIIQKEGSLAEAFSSGALSSDLIVETLKKMAGVSKDAGQATEDMTAKLEKFQKVVDQVWNGDFKNGEERIKALTDAGYDYAKVQDLVNKTVDGHRLTLEDLSDAQLLSVGYTEEEITKLRELAEQAEKTGTPLNKLIEDVSKPSGRELFWDSILNILNSIIDISGAVGKAWRNAFPPMTSDTLYSIIEGFHSFTEALVPTEKTLQNITSTFKGLFAILDIFATITGGALRIGFRLLGEALGLLDVDILSVTASVGEAVANFRDWLFENNLVVDGIEKVISAIGSGISTLRNWIRAFMELPVVQKGISNLESAFYQTLSNLKEYFSGGIEEIKNFISWVKQLDSISLDDVGMILRRFKDTVIDYFLDIDGVFSNLGEAISEFKDDLIDHFQGAGDALDGFIEKFVNFVVALKERVNDTIGIGELLAIGVGVGIIVFVKKIGDALSLLSGPIGSFIDIFDELGDVLDAYSKKLKAEALLKIAQAIATLAASVALLAMLDQGKVWSSVGVLAVLASGLIGLSFALGTFNKLGGVTRVSVSLVALASSMLILSTSLKQMDSLDRDNILGNLATLGALAAGMVASLAVLSRIAPNLSTGSITILSFAASLKILVSVLNDINELEIDRGIAEKLGVMIALIASMSLLMKSVGKISAKGSSAATILATVISLKILIGAFEDIANLDTEGMRTNIEAFISIFAAFAVLMASSRLAGKNAAKAGVGILAMSAALILVVQSFKMIADIDPSELDRASETVSKLLLVFGAVVALSKFAGANAAKAGVMLLAMSASLLIVTAVIAVLTHLDPEGMDNAVKAIAKLELVFGMLIAVSKLAGANVSTITMLSVSVGVLAAAIGILSLVDPGNLTNATNALTQIMAVFGLLVASTSLAQKAMGTILVLTLVVGALAGILALLSSLPVESSMGAAQALSLLLITLSASLLIISNARMISATAYATLGVMLLTLAGIAAIIGILAALDLGPTLEIAQSLSILLLALSAACLILAGVGATGPSALIGALVLDGVIVAIGGLMAGIGALATYYPSLEEFVNKGIVLLQAIGTGIGSFVGGIIGGIGETVSSSLPAIAENLSGFMTGLQPFIESANQLDSSAVDGVKSLAEALLILTGSNILESLTSWLTGGSSLADFAEQLIPFGEAMSEFSYAVAGMDSNVVQNAANAGKAVAEMAAALPNSGGVLGFFSGENDMATFGAQLVPFGLAIKSFSLAVAGLDANVVVNAATAGKAVAEMAATLPNSGGVLGFFAGENDMVTFGAQLIPFGLAIKNFSLVVAGLDANVVVNAANAGKAVAEMAATLPNSGGLIGFFAGENDMGAFGAQLVSFGIAMKAFSLSIAGMDTNAVVNSATAGKALSELASTIPNTGGLIAFFSGENDMATFGSQLISFGRNFKSYSDYMKEVDPSVVTNTSNAANSLVTLANSLPSSGGWFSDNTTLDTFGSQLSKFGEYFASYYEQISDVDSSKLSSVITQVNRLVTMAKGMSGVDFTGMSSFATGLRQLGNSGVDEFLKAFSDADSKTSSAINSFFNGITSAIGEKTDTIKSSFAAMVDIVVSEINSKQTQFKDAGEAMLKQLSTGISEGTDSVKTAFSSMLTQAISDIRSKYDEFKSAGSFLVSGFANGIGENAYKAKAQAQAMAKAAQLAAEAQLGIASPSKVFFTIGGFVVAGLVNGIKNNVVNVQNASSNMANVLVDSFETSVKSKDIGSVGHYIVQNIADGIEEDMSAEEAASKKAQNIVNAFQKEFDKLDSTSNTADLEYQLWEALNEDTASDAEKTAKKLEYLQNEYARQVERVKLAQAEYKTTVDTLGASSEEAQDAYDKLLQKQIDLTSTVKEINTLQAETATSYQDSFQKYSDYLTANQAALEKAGLSLDQIKDLAADRSGFDENAVTEDMTIDVKKAVSDAMSNVTVAYQENVENTFGTLVTKSSTIGENMANAIGQSIVEKTPEASNNVSDMMDTCANKIEQDQPKWVDGAAFLVDGFVQGITDNINKAAQAAAAMARIAYNAAMSEIGGTSDVSAISDTIETAVSSGISNGVSSGSSSSSKKATSSIAKTAVAGVSTAISAVMNAINNGIDSEPVIKPVLDLSDVKSGITKLNTMVSSTKAANVSTKVNETASTNQNGGKVATSSTSNFNFTQNNYSPKALSRVDIYRQTKNQFSSFERSVQA